MAKLVCAIFKNRSNAMLAMEDMLRHGFPQEDISALLTDTSNGREFGLAMRNKLPEGSALGTLIGGAAGALFAGLVATGQIADPGLGLAGVQPLVSTFAGFGAGAACGYVAGAIVGAAIPEYEADFISLVGKKPNHNGILLGIYCDASKAAEARKLLDAAGGSQITTKNVKTEKFLYEHPAVAGEYRPPMTTAH